ncbi:MAG: YtxH domain-containing protein [bacterium]|nr:YtxH domain-containing protein [bacterium]MBK9304751.1 YtxH domain-containing protein [bacterium]
MSRHTNTLLAFVLGAAVGGITALLLAPDKGENTRRRLRDGGAGGLRRSKDALNRTAASLEEDAREKGQNVSDAVRQRVEAARGAVSEARDAYRREMDRT